MLNSAVTKFVQLINLKLLTIANSFLLNIAEHENKSADKYENANYCWHFLYLLAEKISCSAELRMKIVLYPRSQYLCNTFVND